MESDDVSQVQECKNQEVIILGKGRFINTTACESVSQEYFLLL